MKLLSLIALIAVLYEANAASRRNCGQVLLEVLTSVCSGQYNRLPFKKSVPAGNGLEVLDVYDGDASRPFLSGSQFLDDLLLAGSNTFAETRKSHSLLGLYEECCVKSCDFQQLNSYCA